MNFAAGVDATHVVLALLLGLGLAASTGLNTFLPLLMLAVAGRFHFAGVALHGPLSWLASDTALVALAIATVAEIVGDKVPVVDHGLDVLGTVARPLAGWLATATALGVAHTDPTTAAVLGLVIGVPTAFGFHAAKSATRAASSAATFGIANPVLSVVEDVLSFGLSLVSIFAPILVPVALAFLGYGIWRVARRIKRRRLAAKGTVTPPPT